MSLAKRREFLMRERWFSLWDKVDVMDPVTEEPVGHFQKKLFTLRTQYRLQDPLGDIELIVQQKLMAWRPTYKFFPGNPSGEPDQAALLGTLTRGFLPFYPHYWFNAPDGTRKFDVEGDLFALSYDIFENGQSIGSVSKTFWAIRDTYGLRIDPSVPDQTALLLLGAVMVIHAIHEKRERRSRG
jgi:uncharacterized protein YxjI